MLLSRKDQEDQWSSFATPDAVKPHIISYHKVSVGWGDDVYEGKGIPFFPSSHSCLKLSSERAMEEGNLIVNYLPASYHEPEVYV
jgi:hypothetical protein